MTKKVKQTKKRIVEIRENGSRRVSYAYEGKSLTEQQHRSECTPQAILERHRRTGVMTVMKKSPTYNTFTPSGDYLDACNVVIAAQSQFDSLPAAVRDRFGNNPEEFLAFCNDENNADEMIKMGLKDAPPREEPEQNIGGGGSPQENTTPKTGDENAKTD